MGPPTSSSSCPGSCPTPNYGLWSRPSTATLVLVSRTLCPSLTLPSPLRRGLQEQQDPELMAKSDTDPQLRLKKSEGADRVPLALPKTMAPQKSKKDSLAAPHQCSSCCVSGGPLPNPSAPPRLPLSHSYPTSQYSHGQGWCNHSHWPQDASPPWPCLSGVHPHLPCLSGLGSP